MSLINYSFFSMVKDHIPSYPGFSSLNYFWNFGFLAFICLFFQMMTGFMISFYYSASVELAFFSIEHFMSSYKYGWLMSYFHSNGASLFFMLIYFHIASGIYYKSYSKTLLWLSGFMLFVLTFAVCFLGYVLPWGQMSYWGCTVMTNLVTVFPYMGGYMLHCLWGGEIMSEMTLVSIYSIHFMLPFILLALSIVHVSILHIEGGSGPLGIENYDYMVFYPYLVIKDIFSFIFFTLGFYIYFIFFNPNYLGECLNYVQVDYVETPLHMVPEWYFLPYYCMLSCMYHKTGGILCFAFSVIMVAFLVFFPISSIPVKFDIYHKIFFFFFFSVVLTLGWLASELMSDYMILYSSIFTILYFLCYILLFINACIENFLMSEMFKNNNTNYKYFKLMIIKDSFLMTLNYIILKIKLYFLIKIYFLKKKKSD